MDYSNLIILIVTLAALALLSRVATVWRLRRTAKRVVSYLEQHRAFHPASAVELPRQGLMQIVLRNSTRRAVQSLLNAGIVGLAENGKYYLNRDMIYLLRRGG
jgi:hypothetical protein